MGRAYRRTDGPEDERKDNGPARRMARSQALSVAAMVLVTCGGALALREALLADAENGRRHFAPIILLGGFYFFLVFGWGNWIR